MKAPEKIYVKINHPFRGVTEIIGFEHGSGIEYTQTDAFIEKACKWLQEHKNDYAFPIYQGEELTDESYVSDDIIKDLRKVMEE